MHISKTELDKSVLRAWNMNFFLSFGAYIVRRGGRGRIGGLELVESSFEIKQ